jgi:hypothetical protein
MTTSVLNKEVRQLRPAEEVAMLTRRLLGYQGWCGGNVRCWWRDHHSCKKRNGPRISRGLRSIPSGKSLTWWTWERILYC